MKVHGIEDKCEHSRQSKPQKISRDEAIALLDECLGGAEFSSSIIIFVARNPTQEERQKVLDDPKASEEAKLHASNLAEDSRTAVVAHATKLAEYDADALGQVMMLGLADVAKMSLRARARQLKDEAVEIKPKKEVVC